MRYQVFDIETSIGKDPNTIHGLIQKKAGEDVKVILSKNPIPVNFNWNLTDTDIIVGHNIKFDLGHMWKNDTLQAYIKRGGLIWDTMYVEYLLSGQTNTFPSLKKTAHKYLGSSMKEDRITIHCFKKGIGTDQILAHPRAKRLQKLFKLYCVGDGLDTEAIYLKQLEEVEKKGMKKIVEVYNAYLLSQIEEEQNGMHIDVSLCTKEKEDMQIDALNDLEALQERVAPFWSDLLPEFNINSKEHLSALIYGGEIKYKKKVQEGFFKNGNPKMKSKEFLVKINAFESPRNQAIPTKKDGVFKVDTVVLNELMHSKNKELASFCEAILAFRKKEKLIRTYYTNLLKAQRDGIIHQSYRHCLIPSARLSCSNPNLQNQHPKVKHLFTSRYGDEGSIVEIDFGQLEVICQAWITGSRQMIKDIEAGVDFHCKRLAYAEDKPYEEVVALCATSDEWKLKRKAAKTISFQKAYGAMPESIALSTGLPVETVKKVFEKEDAEYPEIAQFYEGMKEDIQRTCILINEPVKIKNKTTGKDFFDPAELKHRGFYQAPTGKIYAFDEKAVFTKRGDVFRYWPQPDIYNYPIQGTGSVVQAVTNIEVFKFMQQHRDKGLMVNEVHDSKIFDIKNKYISLLIPELVSIMSNIRGLFNDYLHLGFDVPLGVDVSLGRSWGEVDDYSN